MANTIKAQYDAPSVTVLGSFEQITQAGNPDGNFDANYSAGQPIPPGGPGAGPGNMS